VRHKYIHSSRDIKNRKRSFYPGLKKHATLKFDMKVASRVTNGDFDMKVASRVTNGDFGAR